MPHPAIADFADNTNNSNHCMVLYTPERQNETF